LPRQQHVGVAEGRILRALRFSAKSVTIHALEAATSARMHGISLRALILASLAVFGVDVVSTFLLIALFGGPAFDSSMTDAQIAAAMQVLLQDARYLTIALIFGTASTVLGGFLAARIAGKVPYFNALAFGICGLVLSMLATGEVPTWFKICGLTLTLPAALLGGHLAKQRAQAERS
jgi:hypothetical protein